MERCCLGITLLFYPVFYFAHAVCWFLFFDLKRRAQACQWAKIRLLFEYVGKLWEAATRRLQCKTSAYWSHDDIKCMRDFTSKGRDILPVLQQPLEAKEQKSGYTAYSKAKVCCSLHCTIEITATPQAILVELSGPHFMSGEVNFPTELSLTTF